MTMKRRENLSFWQWLLKGSGASPGYQRYINIWIVLHFCVGFVLSNLVQADLVDAANAVSLPLVGIFLGSFAWARNAHALLLSREIEEIADFHEGGFAEYVFVYQGALFAIFLTLIIWGLASLGVFTHTWPTPTRRLSYSAIEVVLYALLSLALRECWHIVQGTHWMLLAQREIKRAKKIRSAKTP
ncbi:MAG: hypothetical protein D6690_14605 [Nitrospirae bacterium]|nr:MAG: hypothetical protein D6690_14605 [Nitrospirota bacterium]